MMDDINEMQLQLELINNKNQLLPRLRETFGNEVIVDHLRESGIPINFGINMLSHLGLHKRASFRTLFGILHPEFNSEEDGLQLCADMMTKAVIADLCDYDHQTEEFIVSIPIPADVQQELDRYQYPLPMVVKPNKLTSNKSSAYFTGGGSVLLKGYNHHDDDVCLEHLNKSNEVALTLNQDTSRMIQNTWASIDKQKTGETYQDFRKRKAAFAKYDRDARDVMDLMFTAGNRFYMTHKYDKRGRTYSQGYHINPQGNDWNKAVIEFADKELIAA
jgi:hypothetical protein